VTSIGDHALELTFGFQRRPEKMKKKIAFTFNLILMLIVVLTSFGFGLKTSEPVARVSGSGERQGITLTVAAVAHSLAIDDVSGSASFYDRNTNSRLSVEVTGVSIVINDRLATVSGEVTRATGNYAAAFPVGSRVSFQVDDEGEGGGAIPDGFTIPSGGASTEEPPARQDGGILPASERGNLRIEGDRS
jgi:hypothetical protein